MNLFEKFFIIFFYLEFVCYRCCGNKVIFLVNRDFLCLVNGRFFGIVIISLFVLVRICVDLLIVVLVVFVFGID